MTWVYKEVLFKSIISSAWEGAKTSPLSNNPYTAGIILQLDI